MKNASARDLSEKDSNHAAQVKAMRNLSEKEKKDKDAIICDQANKLQTLRTANNLVSMDVIILQLIVLLCCSSLI